MTEQQPDEPAIDLGYMSLPAEVQQAIEAEVGAPGGGHDVWGADFGQVGWHQPEPLSEPERPREASPPVAASQDQPTPHAQAGERAGAVPADLREPLGRLVHETRRSFGAALDRPFLPAPWEERHERQRELDMQIGEAVAAAVRERIAARMDALAANYPEDVFPRGSGSRDAISGTAMRLAYQNAAREIREGDDGC